MDKNRKTWRPLTKMGKPPALPEDPQSLTIPGVKRKPPRCEPLKVYSKGGFLWTREVYGIADGNANIT